MVQQRRRTQQCLDNFQITIQEIIEHAYYNTTERFFGMPAWARSEDVKCGRGGTVIVKPLGGWLGEYVIRNGDLLESVSCVCVVWKFAAVINYKLS
jgi:hypothetical protein